MAPGVRWSLLALGATLLLAGCGGDVDPGRTPAGLAQVRFLDNLYNGRLDPVYATLHPAYQRLVPRKRFVACTRAAALGGLDSIEILDVYDDPVEIPGSGRVRREGGPRAPDVVGRRGDDLRQPRGQGRATLALGAERRRRERVPRRSLPRRLTAHCYRRAHVRRPGVRRRVPALQEVVPR